NTGTAVAQSGVVITASIASGAGTLGGTLTASTDGTGLATFADLKISGTIGDRTVRFDATSLTGVVSGTITVTAGPASQLSITTQPSSSAQSGFARIQQTVWQLRVASGNAGGVNGVMLAVA